MFNEIFAELIQLDQNERLRNDAIFKTLEDVCMLFWQDASVDEKLKEKMALRLTALNDELVELRPPIVAE